MIGLGVVVIVLIIGGYFLFSQKPKTKTNSPANMTQDSEMVQKLSPQAIGLTMETSPDNKKVRFSVTKASDIKAIEYQIMYEADSTAQEIAEGGDKRVQRGITGDVESSKIGSSYQSDWIDLGSCSSGTCRYDKGVTSLQMTLKVTKKDGKTYEVDTSLDLSSQ